MRGQPVAPWPALAKIETTLLVHRYLTRHTALHCMHCSSTFVIISGGWHCAHIFRFDWPTYPTYLPIDLFCFVLSFHSYVVRTRDDIGLCSTVHIYSTVLGLGIGYWGLDPETEPD